MFLQGNNINVTDRQGFDAAVTVTKVRQAMKDIPKGNVDKNQ